MNIKSFLLSVVFFIGFVPAISAADELVVPTTTIVEKVKNCLNCSKNKITNLSVISHAIAHPYIAVTVAAVAVVGGYVAYQALQEEEAAL